MAKQRGTHQIAGTINNLVYYEQKYVKGGLIRRQNEAMSERLKTDPVFAGTRKANSLYGACMMVASAIFKTSSYRSVYMSKPSRLAKLATSILRMYQNTNGYDKELAVKLEEYSDADFIISTDAIAKNNLGRFFSSIPRVISGVEENEDIAITIPWQQLRDYADYCGVDRVQVEIDGVNHIGASEKDLTTGKFIAPSYSLSRIIVQEIYARSTDNLLLLVDSGTKELPFSFIYISILPVVSGAGATAVYKRENACSGYCIVKYQN